MLLCCSLSIIGRTSSQVMISLEFDASDVLSGGKTLMACKRITRSSVSCSTRLPISPPGQQRNIAQLIKKNIAQLVKESPVHWSFQLWCREVSCTRDTHSPKEIIRIISFIKSSQLFGLETDCSKEVLTPNSSLEWKNSSPRLDLRQSPMWTTSSPSVLLESSTPSRSSSTLSPSSRAMIVVLKK